MLLRREQYLLFSPYVGLYIGFEVVNRLCAHVSFIAMWVRLLHTLVGNDEQHFTNINSALS